MILQLQKTIGTPMGKRKTDFALVTLLQEIAIGSAILIDIPICKMHLEMIFLLQKAIGTSMEKMKGEIVLVVIRQF